MNAAGCRIARSAIGRRVAGYSFGVAGDFLDYIEECERKAEADYNAKYVTCWDRFLNWLGWH